MTSEPSGRLYSLVTKHWPRIAAGFIATLGLIELVLGGLTSDSSVELYLTAWAATTGGLWFLFEKAEKALSEESRTRVVGWVQESDARGAFQSVPAQFALLFDRVFGERHLSAKCFFRSWLASFISVICLTILWLGMRPDVVEGLAADPVARRALLIGLPISAGFFNILPDYLSLLESRWAIGVMERSGRVGWVLFLDLVLTSGISLLLMWGANQAVFGNLGLLELTRLMAFHPLAVIPVSPDWTTASGLEAGMPFSYGIFFYSAFFTSVWLWLYAASVLVSRVLLRMNNGVGFLLRVTDVERQPFRSMGFVSVIIVSVIFALGLPLVLL